MLCSLLGIGIVRAMRGRLATVLCKPLSRGWRTPPSANAFLLEIEPLEALASRFAPAYAHANPFKHVVIDDFLPEPLAKELLRDFPGPASNIWLERNAIHQPGKLGIAHASRLRGLASSIHAALCEFNAYPFINFVSRLTGIDKLLPDPYLHGGGLHQILAGGHLDVHADVTHLRALDLYRRINVLYYLNEGWKPEYGGNLEFWGSDRSSCVKSIAPQFNRLVVFNTNKHSYHGHPAPLRVPKGVTRKSLAFYYYTAQPAPEEEYTQGVEWLSGAS